jgi:hypothetical protein
MVEMRLRRLHIASLILLLASLGVAEGSVVRDSGCTFGRHYISVLLAQQEAASSIETTFRFRGDDALALDLSAASLSHSRTCWTMRPPSAHSAGVRAVTGSGL